MSEVQAHDAFGHTGRTFFALDLDRVLLGQLETALYLFGRNQFAARADLTADAHGIRKTQFVQAVVDDVAYAWEQWFRFVDQAAQGRVQRQRQVSVCNGGLEW